MIQEKIIIGENTNHPLNGILTLPDNEGNTRKSGLIIR